MYSASAFIGPESAVDISVNKSDPSVVREKEGLPSNQRELTLVPEVVPNLSQSVLGFLLLAESFLFTVGRCLTMLSLIFLSSCVLGEINERPVYTESSPPSTPLILRRSSNLVEIYFLNTSAKKVMFSSALIS